MKPHELIQRRRRQRGAKAAPPQMRDRNAAAGAAVAPAAYSGGPDPRNQLPARRPAFAGETRAQELERQRASAIVVRPGPAPVATDAPPAQQPAAVAQPAAAPPPSTQNVITMCACPSHADGDCDNVATLRAVWPVPDGGAWPMLVDVCEECAAAIKADPVGALVTGLQFVALYPPMHEPIGDDDPDGKWGPHASPEEAAEKQRPAAPPSGTVAP